MTKSSGSSPKQCPECHGPVAGRGDYCSKSCYSKAYRRRRWPVERPAACLVCESPMEQPKTGRVRKYCSALCRSAAVELANPGNHAAKMRKYRAAPGNRGTVNNRKSRYGVTNEEFNEAAAGGCQACGSELRLCLDHDHACCPPQRACKDCWRGVLCQDCNHALGNAKDSRDRLLALVAYLDAWEATKASRSVV